MKYFASLLALVLTLGLLTSEAGAVRLKEVVRVKGVDANFLHGLGLIVGLDGTGDGDDLSAAMATNVVRNALREGIITQEQFESKNIAVVAVTAEYPPFGQAGNRVDVKISSLGSAKSLKGGTLLTTYLRGPNPNDKTVYALASGQVLIGAVGNLTTSGELPGGAILEADVKTEFLDKTGRRLVLILNHQDFTTASNVADAINGEHRIFGLIDAEHNVTEIAKALSAGAVQVEVPESFQGREVSFVSNLMQVDVEVDNTGKVVINERAGIVTIGEDVTILPVAVTLKGVTITITPPAGSLEPPKVGSTIELDTQPGKGKKGTPLKQLVDALNNLQIQTDQLIAIIQNLKTQGVLQGQVIVK